MRNLYTIVTALFFGLIILFLPRSINIFEFPTYRVMLDPGHGGVSIIPKSKHGDRFDSISGTYLDYFRYGAARKTIDEHELMYSIAKKTEKILKNCSFNGDFAEFEKLLSGYTDKQVQRINLVIAMSRKASIKESEVDEAGDPNKEYRLFDFSDPGGGKVTGRISRMNRFKPHLVVSLHCAGSGANDYKGMSAVLTAPYSFLKKGLDYLNGENAGTDFYSGVMADNWFNESDSRSSFSWFLNDSSIYFISYPLNEDRSVNYGNFRGYGQNMFSWAYQDHDGWEEAARYDISGSRYSKKLKNFRPEGAFWDRERSKYESFRRDGGKEGYGGDNAYASNEIIRFILYSLNLHGQNIPYKGPGKSYVSIWLLPIHINAISSYMELGYLNRRMDRYFLLEKQDEIAEGIAVGIYSLFAGIEIIERKGIPSPKGKSIDLRKYDITTEKSYFDAVLK